MGSEWKRKLLMSLPPRQISDIPQLLSQGEYPLDPHDRPLTSAANRAIPTGWQRRNDGE